MAEVTALLEKERSKTAATIWSSTSEERSDNQALVTAEIEEKCDNRKRPIEALDFPQTNEDHPLRHNMGQVAVVIHNIKASESPSRNHAVKDDTITTIQQNPKFESLYNQLGLNAEARKLATKMLISLAAKSNNVAMLEVGGTKLKLNRFVLSGYFRCFPALSSTHVQGAADVDHIIHWKITAWQVISVSNA
ncbi:hypothetical protein COLO4_19562 [Corchorus olitorius]|uniref:Uncharacterized protein n=1 Tax=Corchorus olitorius TaxID=93759 RepID=A0A1R3J4U7_9ROSI|nr:hypothetical protein COLO4_19562 [Corchorus olitorius]